ncbi:UDP-4-amino-4-deoxy-L-arabinose--oxoglutarate aminotransferase [Candidatus Methanoperedenaceae archaeon GB37]|nr:UDP-4-amino-4-deoxy-L-arabinose--oxoglutarate aminotransferase [Candidatus Methanoperedenaceae archaeon GB37]
MIETLKSGWLTTGPKVKEFEEKFATLVGAKYAVALNSCTAALHLALEVIGLKGGEEVITFSYDFCRYCRSNKIL